MMAKKRILSWLVAASLALSLLPAAALAAETEEPTLSEEILEPGMTDIVDRADDNAQDLIDKTYDALNPVDPADPDAKPAEDKDAADIVTEETDAETGESKDVVTGEVLTKADEAKEEAERTKHDVENKLTVEVENENGETVKISVDEVIRAEAEKADAAREAAEKAAADAAAAVEAEDEDALAQAKVNAAQAVVEANEAYTNAQTAFDTVIGSLLDEDDQAAAAEKAAKALEEAGITEPGEDATDEEKAAYEAAKVNAENAAKLEAANDKIDSKYTAVNEQIAAAKEALEAAQKALTESKGAYDTAVNTANNASGGVDIGAYVKYFEELKADSEKVDSVVGAYNSVDTAKSAVDDKKAAADKFEENPDASTTQDRVNRDNDFLIQKGETVGCSIYGDVQLKDALKIVQDNRDTLTTTMEQLRNESDPQKRSELCKQIDAAMEAVYGSTYDTTLLRTPYGMIRDRSENIQYGEVLDVNKGLNSALDCLAANLETIRAQYDQVMAEEALKTALASLSSGLSYKEALDVIETIAKDDNLNKRQELADAAQKLQAQKAAAEAAAAKVDEANKAYEAAKAAVEKALEELENAKLDSTDAKAKLEAAKGQLDAAKKAKEDAEDAKKEADAAVIETEDEIEDIITGGNPGGTTPGGDGDGDTGTAPGDDGDTAPAPGGDDAGAGDDDGDATIEDGIVPLALMPTRGELMNFLYVRAGSPAAAPATFADVPADHEFALAIGWAQANGIATAYEDGTFDPDNFVVAGDMAAFLEAYARFSGMRVTFPLTTMAGMEDDAIVENADAILAEFFGD